MDTPLDEDYKGYGDEASDFPPENFDPTPEMGNKYLNAKKLCLKRAEFVWSWS